MDYGQPPGQPHKVTASYVPSNPLNPSLQQASKYPPPLASFGSNITTYSAATYNGTTYNSQPPIIIGPAGQPPSGHGPSGQPPQTTSPDMISPTTIPVDSPPASKTANSPDILKRPLLKGQRVGAGVYGTVYCGYDETGQTCAVKRHLTDLKTSFLGPIREMDILSNLRGHPHIIELRSVSYGTPFSNACSPIRDAHYRSDDLHFIFEQANNDLAKYIMDSRNYSFVAVKHIIIGILLGIEYMHKRNIIHRDIKPPNILFNIETQRGTTNASYVAKICDFGLSKPYTKQGLQTPNMVTVLYRAPEIAMGKRDYNLSSDMWSVGCTLFELMARRPLLNIQRDDNTLMLQTCAHLPVNMPHKLRQMYVGGIQPVANDNQAWANQFGWGQPTINMFNTQGPGTFSEVVDLVRNLCNFDPNARFTASQALEHPFCQKYKLYIDHIRRKYPPQQPEPEKLITINCPERDWMRYIITDIYNRRGTFPWYNHRALFLTVDLFQRYLKWLSQTINRPPAEMRHQAFLDKVSARRNLLVCLYVAIKFYSTLSGALSFQQLSDPSFHDSHSLHLAEEFEKLLIRDVCQHRVYRQTIYEAADELNIILTSKDTARLLVISTCDADFTGFSPGQIMGLYSRIKSSLSCRRSPMQDKECMAYGPDKIKKMVEIIQLIK